jgi:hypothetical protein
MWKAALLATLVLTAGACQESPEPVAVDTEAEADSPSPSPSPIESPEEEEEEPTPEEPDLVTVPDVEGRRLPEARRHLEDAGLSVDVTKRPSDEPPGTVLIQRPIAGLEVHPGRTVRLVVAKPKPPPPPSSNCHSSYTGACLVPNASDYDCAGGSGDGPKYTGTVTVVGPDVYGLDGDGDGVGCE